MSNDIKKYLRIIKESGMMIKLPTMNIKEDLYHVGSLDISKRKNNSHEGRGLSISTEPEAWEAINKGRTVGDTHLVSKSSNKFVDMLRIDKGVYEELFSWGVSNGYMEQVVVYKVYWYDDELEETVYQELYDIDDVKIELEDMDISYEEAIEDEVLEVLEGGYSVTSKFKNETGSEHKDLIVSLYCQNENIVVDGLYWNETLSISKYSAPRGVIFDNMLGTWDIEKI